MAQGNKTTRNVLVALLDELKRQGELNANILQQGSGVLSAASKPKGGDFIKNSLRIEHKKVFTTRLEYVMWDIKRVGLDIVIQHYVAGNQKARSEIERILVTLPMKNSTIAELETILNRTERINNAMRSFSGRIGSELVADNALHEILKHWKIAEGLKIY